MNFYGADSPRRVAPPPSPPPPPPTTTVGLWLDDHGYGSALWEVVFLQGRGEEALPQTEVAAVPLDKTLVQVYI